MNTFILIVLFLLLLALFIRTVYKVHNQNIQKDHMIKKTRQSVFETNSSSTHSICIATDTTIDFPKSLHFEFGEFGWEYNTLNSIEEKASYLYTGLFNNERFKDIESIINILETKNIIVTKEEAIESTHSYKDNNGEVVSYTSYDNTGYVDHSYDMNSFLNEMASNNDSLFKYLFSPLSFVITGNDNDEEDVNINVDYNYLEFYKGN